MEHLSNIDVTVGHSNLSCSSAYQLQQTVQPGQDGSLRGLTTGVGVNSCVEDKDAGMSSLESKNVVKATEADVVCPTVAAEDPEGLLVRKLWVSAISLLLEDQTLKLNYEGLSLWRELHR